MPFVSRSYTAENRPVPLPPLGTASQGRCEESPRPLRPITHHATFRVGKKARRSRLPVFYTIQFLV